MLLNFLYSTISKTTSGLFNALSYLHVPESDPIWFQVQKLNRLSTTENNRKTF
jgi:hypothetical protein